MTSGQRLDSTRGKEGGTDPYRQRSQAQTSHIIINIKGLKFQPQSSNFMKLCGLGNNLIQSPSVKI